MKSKSPLKIKSILDLFEILPENERIIVDVLRQIIIENLPKECKEKISYNVPFFYRKRGLCIVWPSTIPRGGIKEGVLLGFWYGNKLTDLTNTFHMELISKYFIRYISPRMRLMRGTREAIKRSCKSR
jgi:hypothetical protein